jgi:hypothetical protein
MCFVEIFGVEIWLNVNKWLEVDKLSGAHHFKQHRFPTAHDIGQRASRGEGRDLGT